MADITLTQEWTPLGSEGSAFLGELNGNNHKITGLQNRNTEEECQGLFGYIGQGGKISNLTVMGTVQGKNSVGMIAGYNNDGIIENIRVSGCVSGEGDIGGVVGFNKGVIEKCYSEVVVSGSTGDIGGLTGRTIYGIIKKSANKGTVIGHSYVGGVTGYLYEAELEDVYSVGEVNGIGDGSNNIGGLVGRCDNGIITNSYSTSKVTGSSDVGGLLGNTSETYSAIITNSYWTPEKAGIKTSAGGTSLTLDQMKIQSSYEGWDFETIWVMKEYPELNYKYASK